VTTNDSWRRYLEAGAAVGQLTLSRAEEIAKGLVAPGEEQRKTAWREFEDLTRFGRQMGEQLVEVARAELTKQLKTSGVGSFDQVWERITDLIGSVPDGPANTAGTPPETPPEHVEPAVGSNGSAVAEIPEKGSKALNKPKNPKKNKERARGSKAAKGKKKNKENEMVSGAPGGTTGPNRVVTLTLSPDPAGTV
jgi:hypothetical protein